jgi:hypothetical protein
VISAGQQLTHRSGNEIEEKLGKGKGRRTKVDLLAVGVGLESLGDTQDSLNRSIVREKGDVCHVQSRDAETVEVVAVGLLGTYILQNHSVSRSIATVGEGIEVGDTSQAGTLTGGPWGTLNQMDKLRAATTGATR